MGAKRIVCSAAAMAGFVSFMHVGCGGDDSIGGTGTADGGADATTTDAGAGGGDDGPRVTHLCGNGIVEIPEECDNGAANANGSGCQSDCTFTCIAGNAMRACNNSNACNGIQTCGADHKCAAGTPLATGAMCGTGMFCVAGNCAAPSCGDGVVEPGEECDDGNTTNGDGCDNTCKFSCVSTDTTRNCTPADSCAGKGTCNDTTHICAAGTPLMNGVMCGTMGGICKAGVCTSAACGDGVVEAPEQCDFGAGNGVGTGCEANCKFSCETTPSDTCTTTDICAGTNKCASVTGPNNGMGQQCKAGTPPGNGTACANGGKCMGGICQTALCGNGTVNSGEQCDWGTANNIAGSGCEPDCTFSCTLSPNSCPGSDPCSAMPKVCATIAGPSTAPNNGQRCNAAATLAQCAACTGGAGAGACENNVCKGVTCGDGSMCTSSTVACQPPGTPTCSAMCATISPAVCGDGVIQGMEQCDDGNKHDLDGCDSSCNYEVVARMTSVAISGNAAPSFCTPTTNALGTMAITSTALSNVNTPLQNGINAGTTNLMTQFLGLTDLTGVASSGFTVGVADAELDPAKGAYPMNNPIDWWFLGVHSTFANGLPTGQLMNGSLVARNLTAGPSDVSLTLLLAGSPALLEMLNARISATINGTPAPDVPAPPPAALAAGLTVFQTITGSGANQGLCGNITVESLAQIPIPQTLTTGTTACGVCANSHTYTYCGMGNPVGPGCNSLLDALVGGCGVLPVFGSCLATAINPTQPDVASGGAIQSLSVGGALNKVQQTTLGDKDAYSSFMTFDANRAHFTGETCATTADCQSGLTCTAAVCK